MRKCLSTYRYLHLLLIGWFACQVVGTSVCGPATQLPRLADTQSAATIKNAPHSTTLSHDVIEQLVEEESEIDWQVNRIEPAIINWLINLCAVTTTDYQLVVRYVPVAGRPLYLLHHCLRIPSQTGTLPA